MQKILSHFLFLSVLLFNQLGIGQSLGPLYKSNWIPVSDGIGGSSLDYAWAGGINACLVNTIDLNGDQIDDLMIYDRSSERAMTFKASNSGGTMHYEYAPEFEQYFPKLENWVLLRDLDCDGKKDIFTSRPGGIRIFKNTSSGTVLSFELKEDLLESIYDFGIPFEANIYVSSVDVPAIADHDGDGDLDIITFSLNVGGTIEYHKNFSMENYGHCDSLDFEMRNQCYGYMRENSASPQIELGYQCTTNVIDPKKLEIEKHNMHAGSTICTFDYDQNGYLDLLIGDITADSLSMLYNGPSSGGTPDSLFLIETSFPQSNVPATMHTFLGSYYEDVDFDGINDLLVTINKDDGTKDLKNLLYYKNNGANDLPNFNLVQNDFMGEKMIELGSISFPHFFDHNSDGLMDLLVSSRGFFQENSSEYDSRLFLFENTGTATLPSLSLVNDDYASMSTLGFGEQLYPTFGDLDGDGDEDMVLGDITGVHRYFENTAGVGNVAAFSLSLLEMLDIDGEVMDPGQWITPQLFDLDSDGDLDLITGERNGNVNYYENVGTGLNPMFEFANDSLGDFHVDENGDTVGYSVPFAFDNDGETQMIVTNDEGMAFHLNSIEGNISGTFNILDSSLYDLALGERSSAALFDINNDGQYDMISGNEAGGLSFYGSFMVSTPVVELEFDPWNIYPNPSSNEVFIESKTSEFLIELRVFNVLGKLVYEDLNFLSGNYSLDVKSWKNGVYIIQGRTDKGIFSKRFIKQ